MVPEYYIISSVESHIQWATSHSTSAESIMVGPAEHALPAKSLFCIKICYKKVLDSQVPLVIVNPMYGILFSITNYRRSQEQVPLLKY